MRSGASVRGHHEPPPFSLYHKKSPAEKWGFETDGSPPF